MRNSRLILLAGIFGLAACMPQERINRSCKWTGDTAQIAPRGSRAWRDHLQQDVRVAQDLGIRYGDSVGGRVWTDRNRQARESCTNASVLQIMRQHSVSRADIAGVTGARDPWLDVVLVVLPMLILFVAASRIVVRHVTADYDPEDRVVALVILAFLTPLVAFVGLGFAQVWSVLVEEWRLRSDHISYRAAYLPLYVYKEIAWATAAAVFLAVAGTFQHRSVPARRSRVIPANSRGLTGG